MTTRMLIDARHPEETRVAVLKGNRIEEFDFESAEHKQIKGNIYLAKVTRVEPSLQAAFVDFGGNRHGFLAFSEIHPDYYQIPKEDREALLAEEEALRSSEADDEDDEDDADVAADGDRFAADELDQGGGVTEVDTSEKDQVATIEAGQVEAGFEDEDGDGGREDEARDRRAGRGQRRQGRPRSKEAEEARAKRMALRRRYKIQDVIHRRQVLLVQVVKEERGNKGAALTSYLSLAGRYCVLMPNSSHGGGISRKISSAADRKRLKTIIDELGLPRSMGCIVRTAGLQRTRAEIKRDFDYLARLWDEIRDNTLKSSAPALIHSDSDLVKRAIRDIYNRDIEEVVVEGEDGYRAARAFMKLLMPSHARRVKQYADPVPLYQRYGAEDQLTAMYDPIVQLKSGGYIVINPTEALVSIDINSGRSTKEYGIEATALNTNLEASREIARQLRLRDMAGLVVIDFIDMEHGSSVRKVEKAVKDALRDDRARIQVGRISSFGLMEMSRQRLRTGVLEATTRTCPHCDGSGLVRTASSAGLSALRLIEDEAAKGRGSLISLYASTEAAIYLLNAKRGDLREIEDRYGVMVEVLPEGENEGAKMRAVSSGPRPEAQPRFTPIVLDEDDDDAPELDEAEFDADDVTVGGGRPQRAERDDEEGGDGGGRKRRKRRRGGKGRRDDAPVAAPAEAASDEDDDAREPAEAAASDNGDGVGDGAGDGTPRKRRRRNRRRRGGRGRDEAADAQIGAEEVDAEVAAEPEHAALAEALPEPIDAPALTDDEPPLAAPAEPAVAEAEIEPGEPAPKPARRRRAAATDDADPAVAPKPRVSRRKPVAADAAGDEPAAKPKRARKPKAEEATEEPALAPPSPPEDSPEVDATDTPAAEPVPAFANGDAPAGSDAEAGDATPRRGWWQRTFGT